MISYTEDEESIIFIINTTCSALSFLGSLFIFFMFIIHEKTRKLPYRLILYLTISDLGTATAFCFPAKTEIICQIQGALLSYFMLSSIFWCGIISHAMVKIIKCNTALEKYEKFYIFAGFICPMFTLLILLDINGYSRSYGWCWVHGNTKEDSDWLKSYIYRLATYYVPLLVIEIYIVYQAVSMRKYFHATSDVSAFHDELKRKIIAKMRLYPLVLFVCQMPCVVLRILAYWGNPPWVLAAVSGAGLSINGMLNAIVYGVTQDIKNKLKHYFSRSKSEELVKEMDTSTN